MKDTTQKEGYILVYNNDFNMEFLQKLFAF